jgi:3-oxoacyl-[acyl-carrier protein] reductase
MSDRSVVLITGSSRGLGRVTALEFARQGFDVAVHYHSHVDEAKETAALLKSLGATSAVFKADVTKSNEVDEMLKAVGATFGKLDVLFANAGLVRNRTIARMSDDEWGECVAGNLTGTFFTVRAALPLLRKSRGHVLTVSSSAARRGSRGAANYAAAKAGIEAFTRSLAQEEAAAGVRANVIIPGFHVTDINRDYWEKAQAKIMQQHLLGKLPDREELARFVVGVAKLQSVTGQIFAFESRIL